MKSLDFVIISIANSREPNELLVQIPPNTCQRSAFGPGLRMLFKPLIIRNRTVVMLG
jgi:hypothetical protein